MKAFVAKTPDGYLCPREGDVGWTSEQADAGHFFDEIEARETAELAGYETGEIEVILVDVETMNRN